MPQNFAELSESILKSYLEMHPGVARYYIGLHEYDGKMPDFSRQGIETWLATARQQLADLNSLDPAALTAQEKFDVDLLQHNLEAGIFELADRREWESSPLFYAGPLALYSYLSRNYAPLEDRVAALVEQQKQVPGFLKIARENLKPPFSRSLLEVSLMALQGEIRLRQTEVETISLSPHLSSELQQASAQVNREAIAAIQGLVDYLKEQQAEAHDDFALGRENYEKLLRYNELLEMPLEDVLAAGERNLQENFEAINALAKEIDPAASLSEIKARFDKQHPTNAELIPYTQGLLENIREFLVTNDLITIPNENRATVAPTPASQRWSFASMAPSGPYETSNESYYFVTPPEDDWSPERAEDWLTVFNYGNLEDISIHEVYPGHFVHFQHIHQAPSKVTRVLLMSSPCHAEGWAHYAEQMMLEQGYGKNDPAIRLAQLTWALVRNCRYVASIKMHTQGMSVEEATRLFMTYAGLMEGPARAEALRGTFDPGYFSYTLGKLMFLKMREDLQKREGEKFSLKTFHDACVGNGAPPLPLLRKKLLGAESGSLL
ncbi:MAG: DUF885 domain-containing protein [Chloroflexi bacterium]|nr:DUF885 domain-containing protein [Chloroflexota bacterium]OJW06299.1 MAG: hypothetical protein BGO39_26070 [Chloroflexi bacterium 54-19]